MSDYLPFEIQVEIMKSLPVKSLLQFRSVSKEWKSKIDSPDFIVHHSTQHPEVRQHLLVTYDSKNEPKYVSIVDDDDTFPEQKASLTSPVLVNWLESPTIIGCSYGCFCLVDHCRMGLSDGHISGNRMAVLWNPSIRKAVAVIVPHMVREEYSTDIGFGVCRETVDPKIVKITQIDEYEYNDDGEEVKYCISWQVEVFTLSTGVWRSSLGSSNLPRKSIRFCYFQEVMDGILYWHAKEYNRGGINDEVRYYNLILSFDLTSEEFGEIHLPDSLANDQSVDNLYISQLRKSLVVLERDVDEMGFIVWMMEGGVPISFTKLFKICIPDVTVCSVREFRKSGEPVILIEEPHADMSLVAYEPCSKHITYLGIDGTCSVFSYVETLFLLDQPDFIIYDYGNRYLISPEGSTTQLLEHTSKIQE